jgi:acetyl-CoA synthetase
MAAGDEYTEGHDLSSIRVLGSVGEPINDEAWHWYFEKIGRGRAPVIDTWWQTETGGIMISPLPGITDTKPCYASYPLPGIQPVLVDPSGNVIEGNNAEGLLCIKFPWPSVIRTTWGEHERCRQSYFAAFPGLYFTGDGAKRDEDGRYRIIGRVDDVINVSGHRIGTAEVENAIDEHENVVESAVVGYPHPIKGQGIYAYVIVHHDVTDVAEFQKEINTILVTTIGPIIKADRIMIVTGLPKTRSGKIMRRVLRQVAMKEFTNLGDISTLLNPEIVDEIVEKSLTVN